MKKILKTFLLPLLILIGFGGGLAVANFFNGSNSISTTTSSAKVTTSENTYTTTTDTTEAIKKVQDAVVSVINYQTDSSLDSFSSLFGNNASNATSDEEELQVYGEGSGVIYKVEGDSAYLVTNNHVISGAKEIEILLANGTKVAGELVGADSYSDLAVVKISSEEVTTVAEFADSTTLTVGEPAIAIGSPLGSEYANSVTQGIVSSLSRTITGQNEDGENISTNAIQTDAAINPGNSGGPLINIHGQIIGINSSKISASGSSYSSVSVEGMGFAIPSNDVVSIINQLESQGSVTRPALGISMLDLSTISTSAAQQLNIPEEVTSGVIIRAVQSGMPADGKLETYDVITQINGEEVTSISDLQSILYQHTIGDTIEVTYYRDGKESTVSIELTKTSQDLS